MSLFEENVSNIRFIAWDTETTGLSARADEVVEIAALAFDEDFEHRHYQSLIKPRMPIPKNVVAVHGIDDAMVAESPGAGAVFAQFFEFLRWVGQPRVLIAHNAAFDVGMVHGELLRQEGVCGAGGPGEAEASPEVCIDTCQLARALVDDVESYSLANLAARFGIAHEEKHRASGDVRALKALFMKLLEIASDLHADSAGLSLARLVRLCGGHYQLRTASSGMTLDVFKTSFRLSPELERLAGLCGGPRSVAIRYDREESWRYITPLAVKNRNSRLYLEAFCHRDQIKKTFRGDRIRAVGKILESEIGPS